MGNIYLTGFMGAGKSTTGALLAKEIGWTFVDLDEWLERKEGMTIPEIFVTKGEKVFRQMESNAIRELSQRERLVVALGGGAVMDPENRKILFESGTIIYLKVSIDNLLDRIRGTDRPLAQEAVSLFEERKEIYDEANIIIETKGEDPGAIAKMIAEKLK